MKNYPDFSIENEILANNDFIIAGTDEAGRGPLCGPVVACAVIIPQHIKIECVINDSKQMTHKMRSESFEWLTNHPEILWAIGQCSPTEIDDMNILQASLTAMKRAIFGLSIRPDFILVDGNKMPRDIIGKSVVKGDSKSISIAAASIIAKETRDKIMNELSKEFPMYGWDKNAGYPTPSHLQAIEKYGINEHYRKSFKPIKDKK